MDYFELYKARLSVGGNSIADTRKNSTINSINNSFKDSPSYKLIKVSSIDTDSRIISGINTEGSGIKYAQFLPGSNYDIGEYIEFDNSAWIITDFYKDEIYPKAKITKCNYTLKWKDVYGVIVSMSCIATNATLYSEGLKQDKLIITPDGKLSIILPYNGTTSGIIRDNRILFHKQPYKITFIDKSQTDEVNNNGLISFILMEDEIQSEDDLVNGIAFNESMESSIMDSSETTNTIGNYEISIQGNDYIKQGMSSTYYASITNNGIVENKTVTWSIVGLIASITSVNNNSCTIKAGNTKSTFILKAICNEDNNLFAEKIVTVESIF